MLQWLSTPGKKKRNVELSEGLKLNCKHCGLEIELDETKISEHANTCVRVSSVPLAVAVHEHEQTPSDSVSVDIRKQVAAALEDVATMVEEVAALEDLQRATAREKKPESSLTIEMEAHTSPLSSPLSSPQRLLFKQQQEERQRNAIDHILTPTKTSPANNLR